MTAFPHSLHQDDQPEPLDESRELHVLAKKYGDSLERDFAAQGFAVDNSFVPVGESVTVKSILKDAHDEKIVTLTVQFAPEKFYLSHIHTEDNFRRQGHADRLFAWVSNFLSHEKQDYGFSMSGFSETTARYARKYFDILSEKGHKIRGRVRPINTSAAED